MPRLKFAEVSKNRYQHSRSRSRHRRKQNSAGSINTTSTTDPFDFDSKQKPNKDDLNALDFNSKSNGPNLHNNDSRGSTWNKEIEEDINFTPSLSSPPSLSSSMASSPSSLSSIINNIHGNNDAYGEDKNYRKGQELNKDVDNHGSNIDVVNNDDDSDRTIHTSNTSISSNTNEKNTSELEMIEACIKFHERQLEFCRKRREKILLSSTSIQEDTGITALDTHNRQSRQLEKNNKEVKGKSKKLEKQKIDVAKDAKKIDAKENGHENNDMAKMKITPTKSQQQNHQKEILNCCPVTHATNNDNDCISSSITKKRKNMHDYDKNDNVCSISSDSSTSSHSILHETGSALKIKVAKSTSAKAKESEAATTRTPMSIEKKNREEHQHLTQIENQKGEDYYHKNSKTRSVNNSTCTTNTSITSAPCSSQVKDTEKVPLSYLQNFKNILPSRSYARDIEEVPPYLPTIRNIKQTLQQKRPLRSYATDVENAPPYFPKLRNKVAIFKEKGETTKYMSTLTPPTPIVIDAIDDDSSADGGEEIVHDCLFPSSSADLEKKSSLSKRTKTEKASTTPFIKKPNSHCKATRDQYNGNVDHNRVLKNKNETTPLLAETKQRSTMSTSEGLHSSTKCESMISSSNCTRTPLVKKKQRQSYFYILSSDSENESEFDFAY